MTILYIIYITIIFIIVKHIIEIKMFIPNHLQDHNGFYGCFVCDKGKFELNFIWNFEFDFTWNFEYRHFSSSVILFLYLLL